MTRRTLSLAVLSLGVVASVASGDKECDTATEVCDTGVEADADTDTDADSDTDSDTDADTDVDDTAGFNYTFRGTATVTPGSSWDGVEEFAAYNTSRQDICVWEYALKNVEVRSDCADCDWAFAVEASGTTNTVTDQCAAPGLSDSFGSFSADGDEYNYGYIADYEGYEVLAYYFSGYGWYPVAGAAYAGSNFSYDWPGAYYYAYTPI